MIEFAVAGSADPARSSERPRSMPPATIIAVFTTRPDTLYGATYMVLAPENPLVDRLTTDEQLRGSRRISRTGFRQVRPRAHRSREGKDRRFHRRLRDQSRERRANSDLDRRLRSDGLRHGRDHGRAGARRARFGVRAQIRAADCRSRPAARRAHSPTGFIGDGVAINSPLIDGLTTPEAKRRITAWLEEQRPRPAHRQLQTARLAFLAPALLGRAVPDRLARRQTSVIRRGRAAARSAAAGGFQADRHRRAAAGPRRGMGALFGKGDARTEHHAAMGRLVLVLPALLRSPEIPSALSSATDAERILDGVGKPLRGPLRRRHRARGAPPSLRALLAQGAVRSRARLDERNPFSGS